MSVLIIGNFDGVHRGHQALIRRAVEIAQIVNGQTFALTFDPHPAQLLRPESAPTLLTTLEEKCRLLQAAGVDRVIVQTFDRLFSELSPRAFVEQIIVPLQVQTILIGQDFHFGNQRTGTIETLTELGSEFDYTVEVIEPLLENGSIISSTRVRQALAKGDLTTASLLLGQEI